MPLSKPFSMMASLTVGLLAGFMLCGASPGKKDYTEYVDPTIGNVAPMLKPTYPTFQLPNQMMRMSPNRVDYVEDFVMGYPLTLPSHRRTPFMNFRPQKGRLDSNLWRERLVYDHDHEVCRPWLYETYFVHKDFSLGYAPGRKAAIFSIDYNGGVDDCYILVDGRKANFKEYDGGSYLLTDMFEDMKVYCYAEVTDPKGGRIGGVKAVFEADSNRVSLLMPKGTKGRVEFRYAISYISADQAKRNFGTELSNRSFEALTAAGKEAWQGPINQIEVSGSEENMRKFYTAIYRTYERMVDITEDGRYYSGYDKRVHNAVEPFYVDDWVWDTYMATHPLRMILCPDMEQSMLRSYVKMYEQSGWMPQFPLACYDDPAMNGFHSTIVFADAYFKGLRDWDMKTAYEGMRKNAFEATMLPWRNGPSCGLDSVYYEKGYYPSLRKTSANWDSNDRLNHIERSFYPALIEYEAETEPLVHSFEKRQTVAITLGTCYDDWALSKLATELGKPDDAAALMKRSKNFRNIWSDKYRMFIPRDTKGEFIDIDPRFDGGAGFRHYYDENSAYTYAWQVQHDIPALIELLGGKQKAEERLDDLFREPLGTWKYKYWAISPDASGLVGQFSMGNEPSFHIPYLYNYFGAPWKTQQRIRMLLDVYFKDNIFGIPGDEDGGGMSAFIAFSCMGFYPPVAGDPIYTIGSPVFDKTVINLSNGKKFTISAPNCSKENKYIQSATINGRVLNKPFFTHDELMDGATIELVMGKYPNRSWGVE